MQCCVPLISAVFCTTCHRQPLCSPHCLQFRASPELATHMLHQPAHDRSRAHTGATLVAIASRLCIGDPHAAPASACHATCTKWARPQCMRLLNLTACVGAGPQVHAYRTSTVRNIVDQNDPTTGREGRPPDDGGVLQGPVRGGARGPPGPRDRPRAGGGARDADPGTPHQEQPGAAGGAGRGQGGWLELRNVPEMQVCTTLVWTVCSWVAAHGPATSLWVVAQVGSSFGVCSCFVFVWMGAGGCSRTGLLHSGHTLVCPST